MSEPHSHRPGAFHQVNKRYKGRNGRHASKHAVKQRSSGKSAAPRASIKSAKPTLKADRRRMANRKRDEQRRGLREQARKYSTGEAPPKMIAIIPLGDGVNQKEIAELLAHVGALPAEKSTLEEDSDVMSMGSGEANGLEANTFQPDTTAKGMNMRTIYSEKWKQRLCVFAAINRSYEAVLDCAMVADIIVFASHVKHGIDEIGLRHVSAINAQGVPAVMGGLVGVEEAKVNVKKKWRDWVKVRSKEFLELFSSGPRVLPLESSEDAETFLRFLCAQRLKEVSWRTHHPYVVADNVEFCTDEHGNGAVCVSGFVRGANISANDIVYSHAFGHRHLSMIEQIREPCRAGRKRDREGECDTPVEVLERADPAEQQEIRLLADPDAMAGEQTLTAEERDIVEGVQRNATSGGLSVQQLLEMEEAQSIVKKRVPKGTGEYQACWIESDEEDGPPQEESDADSDDDVGEFQFDPVESATMEEANVAGGDSASAIDDDDDVTMSMFGSEFSVLPHQSTFAIDRKERLSEQREDELFPDEVLVPDDVPARFRFAKYEGLQSFRTSPWNVYKNLPPEYARVFRFRNMKRTRKLALLSQQLKQVFPGKYVTLYMVGITREQFEAQYDPTKIFVLSGLLKHEQKLSVLHFMVKRTAEYTDPIKSKDRVLMCCGFRRFYSTPVYSEYAPKCDKQKYERFLHPERTSIATIYGPIMFPPAPVLMLLDGPSVSLVATGSLVSVDPNRPIIKRIVLSGRPVKVKKKTCLAEDMFYDPADVKYFQKVELHTKYGRHGHIVDSVGTHGRMRCRFDQHIHNHDTLLMSLYKRSEYTNEYKVYKNFHRVTRGCMSQTAAHEHIHANYIKQECTSARKPVR